LGALGGWEGDQFKAAGVFYHCAATTRLDELADIIEMAAPM
jgi:hypothetical protein